MNLEVPQITREGNVPYPTTPPGLPQGPSDLSAVTSRVQDYGNEVRQRYQETEYYESSQGTSQDDLLLGLQQGPGLNSSSYPSAISNGDVEGTPEPRNVQTPLKALIVESLKHDLCNDEKRFLPRGRLKSICNFDNVLGELRRILDHEESRTCAEYVCGPRERPSDDNRYCCREIFAILILIDAVRLMPYFMDEGIRDNDLPFRGNVKQTKLWKRDSDERHYLDIFEKMEDAMVTSEFFSKQWWVHVPFIARDEDTQKAREYDLEAGTVMPWSDIVDKETGGFGKVQQVEIDPDHHAFQEHTSFALKTFHQGYNDNPSIWLQETAALRRIRPGPHLVELCAAFKLGDRYMLLFPWAEGGCLEELWKTMPTTLTSSSEAESIDFARWIATQCRGLVQVLIEVHGSLDRRPTRIREPDLYGTHDDSSDIYGTHGDIKPENILHFSQDTHQNRLGSLRIADFGLLEFHREGSRTRRSTETAGAASQTYRSPEHDIDKVISRRIDIWALGCVFSELLTWVIRGPSAICVYASQRFTEHSYSGDLRDKGGWYEDSFFVKHIKKRRMARVLHHIMHTTEPPVTPVPRLKCTVKEGLIKDSGCGPEKTFFQEFLEFIMERMLDPDRKSRAECKEVAGFLGECVRKGENNDRYWMFKERRGPHQKQI